MTIKVGLYGDSFGAGALPKLPDGTYDSGFAFHWINILARKYFWSVTNTAVSGASIFESYINFLNNHHENDKNIFIITSLERYHRSIKLGKNKIEHRFVHLAHLEHWIENSELKLDEDDLETLRDLKGWFLMNQPEYDHEMSELMMKRIQELRPDTIFILTTKFPDFLLTNFNKPLHEIYTQQSHMLGFEPHVGVTVENTKLISGHFTPEFNQVFADYLIERIETGIWPEWKVPDNLKFMYNKKEYFNM